MKSYRTIKELYGLKECIEWLCGLARKENRRSNFSGANFSGANLSGADLSGADLRSVNLSLANFSGSNLSGANLSGVNLRLANLSGANLSGADLSGAILRGVNLRLANLSGVNLSGADLRSVNFNGANFSGADLSGADLRSVNFSGANFSGADLSGADLRGANFSESKGLLTNKEILQKYFKKSTDGYIVYKAIGNTTYNVNEKWVIEENSYIGEVVNQNRVDDCGCGVNFGTLEYVKSNYKKSEYWECLIKFDDLIDTTFPYNFDGKGRCARLKLVKKIEELKK